eukprot:contig_17953_g4400
MNVAPRPQTAEFGNWGGGVSTAAVPGVDHTWRTGRDTIAPSSSSAPTSIVKPYPRLSSFCPFAVPPVSPSLLCPCNASPLFSMAFVAGAALPMTRQRPARATCTMSAGGGEKKSLGQWVPAGEDQPQLR